ncbi:hypothetical protein CDAR_421681 [Caerostris darwini]|uniref:Uncharacterized protein n=1 Tax=Caerostris darwini TaxID=1538125 RepID=A0AAV4V137_9ARAC|nr:hypothetical protein CDAR_421681 [Caerostris darwini]
MTVLLPSPEVKMDPTLNNVPQATKHSLLMNPVYPYLCYMHHIFITNQSLKATQMSSAIYYMGYLSKYKGGPPRLELDVFVVVQVPLVQFFPFLCGDFGMQVGTLYRYYTSAIPFFLPPVTDRTF